MRNPHHNPMISVLTDYVNKRKTNAKRPHKEGAAISGGDACIIKGKWGKGRKDFRAKIEYNIRKTAQRI